MSALTGKHVVVIGGSSGMGLATAGAAAAAGARVTIASRNEARLTAAVAHIGGETTSRQLDITNEAAVAAFFEAVGPIDHLVITAHASSVVTGALKPLSELTLEAARAFLETKFWGPFVAAKYGQHSLSANGSIVLFSGAAGVRKLLPNHATIGAVNGAVEALGRQLAREIAPKRVNVIAPGLVRTPAYDGMAAEMRDAMYAGYARNALVGRVGVPDDIGHAAVYLMANSFITGQVHEIDGGRL